jgi:pseudouridine-5'-phosphate glycosidase
MPLSENVGFAREVEKVVRAEGAVPATTALIDGTASKSA